MSSESRSVSKFVHTHTDHDANNQQKGEIPT
jgi:hypothetical protein